MKKKLNKEALQFLAQKVFDKWIGSHTEFLDDLSEIANDVLFFNAKWGDNLALGIRKSDQNSRKQKHGLPEEILDLQKIVNKKRRKH